MRYFFKVSSYLTSISRFIALCMCKIYYNSHFYLFWNFFSLTTVFGKNLKNYRWMYRYKLCMPHKSIYGCIWKYPTLLLRLETHIYVIPQTASVFSRLVYIKVLLAYAGKYAYTFLFKFFIALLLFFYYFFVRIYLHLAE